MATKTNTSKGASGAHSSISVSVDSGVLMAALRSVAGSVNNKSSHPALRSVRLRADRNLLTLTTCSGEHWSETTVETDSLDGLDVLAPHAALSKFVAECEGRVSLTKEGVVLNGESGPMTFRLLSMPIDDFPVVPDVSGDVCKVTLGELRRVWEKVAYCASDDMSRAYLTGLYFEDGKAVATDTHRLAVCPVSFKEGSLSGIFHLSAFRPFVNGKEGDDATVTVTVSEDRSKTEHAGLTVTAQKIKGAYPNWQRVVPQEHTKSWTLDKLELVKAVRTAMLMAKDNANRVRLKGAGMGLTVSARSEDVGECSRSCMCASSGGDVEIAFNGRYLLDALRACDSEGVCFETTEPSRPAVIRGVPDAPGFVVVMPMALG